MTVSCSCGAADSDAGYCITMEPGVHLKDMLRERTNDNR